MTDVTTLVFGGLLAILILALIALVALVALWALRAYRRKRAYAEAGTSHLDLYFDEHFPNIIKNFDLVSRPRFDLWARDANARLVSLDHDLDSLKAARKGLDTRLDRLEKRIADVE